VRLVDLATARAKAKREELALLDLRQGEGGYDPIEKRKAAKTARMIEAAKAMTFRECAEAYIKAHERDGQWTQSLTDHVYPVFGALPVQAIDLALVLKALEPIWKTKTETASRVRGRIESILGWATTRGYRQGDNPARWNGHLENLLRARNTAKRDVREAHKKGEHLAALPYAELGAFLAELREQEGVGAQALEFLILTAARSGEVRGAQWSEFDLAGRVWTVPGARMKAGKEHRVPLSDAAMQVLAHYQGNHHTAEGLVFPGVSKTILLKQLQRVRPGVTVHGFRSTFRDWAAERTAFPHEVCELALAHTVGSAVERAYQRGDMFEKRRQLAEAWARYCAQVEPAAGEVVPLRA
jgi:integrase